MQLVALILFLKSSQTGNKFWCIQKHFQLRKTGHKRRQSKTQISEPALVAGPGNSSTRKKELTCLNWLRPVLSTSPPFCLVQFLSLRSKQVVYQVSTVLVLSLEVNKNINQMSGTVLDEFGLVWTKNAFFVQFQSNNELEQAKCQIQRLVEACSISNL